MLWCLLSLCLEWAAGEGTAVGEFASSWFSTVECLPLPLGLESWPHHCLELEGMCIWRVGLLPLKRYQLQALSKSFHFKLLYELHMSTSSANKC